MLTLILVPLLLAFSTTSMFILLPLYIYPGTSASAWSNATAAIAAYPKVQWQIIINPNSGPGTTSYPTDSNYIAGISKLNSYPNVITLGYVDTNFAKRAYSAVTSDIDVYAKWGLVHKKQHLHRRHLLRRRRQQRERRQHKYRPDLLPQRINVRLRHCTIRHNACDIQSREPGSSAAVPVL